MDQTGGPTYSGTSTGAAAYETPAQGSRLRYQGVGIRFAATLIDSLVIGFIAWIFIALAIGSAFSTIAPIQPATSGDINATIAQFNSTVTQVSGALSAGIAVAVFLALIVWFLYYTLLEGHYGQTLGKWFVKIKVVKENGAKSATATLR